MKTNKHLLIVNDEQREKLLAVMEAYQKQKNQFSDKLNAYLWNDKFNVLQGASYFECRNNLVKQKFVSPQGLPARLWKLALKEAFELHYRTYSAQLEFVKQKLISKLFEDKFKENKAQKVLFISPTRCFITIPVFLNWKKCCLLINLAKTKEQKLT